MNKITCTKNLGDTALRRINVLNNILNATDKYPPVCFRRKIYSSIPVSSSSSSNSSDKYKTLNDEKEKNLSNLKTFVRIGNSVKEIKLGSSPDKIPRGYLSSLFGEVLSESQQYLKVLRWLMQKDDLKQDTFLIGAPPGSFRRHLALSYAELTNREVEYLCLSRDTTEADIKQRREINDSTISYVNQCAVNAALNGRILIIEGIEKAERNLLPILNNLLENRELNLDDGHFLVAPERYDKLLEIARNQNQNLDKFNLLRVHEDFRVVAIGLPVPKYKGNPLDPPLRSRFQAHHVSVPDYNDFLQYLAISNKHIDKEQLKSLCDFVYSFYEKEITSLNLPDFPLENLAKLVKVINNTYSVKQKSIANHFETYNISKLLNKLYPADILFRNNENNHKLYLELLNKFKICSNKEILNKEEYFNRVDYELVSISNKDPQSKANPELERNFKTMKFKLADDKNDKNLLNVDLVAGWNPKENADDGFVMNKYHSSQLTDMMLTHSADHDFCLIGPQGCGKSELIKQFANRLDYNIQTISLFKDMTSRDLIQQRITMPNGDTKWVNSPLIESAINGDLVILDGIHRLRDDTLMSLRRLIKDRELELNDGRRLLSNEKYDSLVEEINKKNLENKQTIIDSLIRIHPSFRIIATAEPPVTSSNISKDPAKSTAATPIIPNSPSTVSTLATNSNKNSQWLNSEVLNLFFYNNIEPLATGYEHEILSKKFKLNKKHEKLFELIYQLRRNGEEDPQLKHISRLFSLRKLIRLSRALEKYPESVNLREIFEDACLYKFMPQLSKQALNDFLDKNQLKHEKIVVENQIESEKSSIEIEGKSLREDLNRLIKIPDSLFYEIDFHKIILKKLKQDFDLGEHLLLIGNQGTGKNKLADKFLMASNIPREYIQLHRDTTVHSLTVQPVIKSGVVEYEDSPLVKAVKNGLVLVIDEADKAPLHVTSVLKSLIESGEMILSDGRRIVPKNYVTTNHRTSNLIKTHENFRIIVLANRPGYPFLGNDFFSVLGDLLSCHPIDNPDPKSEVEMLKMYGPNVPESTLKKLVSAFGLLRDYSDQGLINYPYSTRELVNIVKHLQKYPDDSLSAVLANIADFDFYNEQNDTKSTFKQIMHKFGIPMDAAMFQVNLAYRIALPGIFPSHKIDLERVSSLPFSSVSLNELKWKVVKNLDESDINNYSLEREESRADLFSELKYSWTLKDKDQIISDMVVSSSSNQQSNEFSPKSVDDEVYICNIRPLTLNKINTRTNKGVEVRLSEFFPSAWHSYYPRLKLYPLKDSERSVCVYEETTSETIKINFDKRLVSRLDRSEMERFDNSSIDVSQLMKTARKALNKFFIDQNQIFKMIKLENFGQNNSYNMFVSFRNNSNQLTITDMNRNREVTLDLNFRSESGLIKLNLLNAIQISPESLLLLGYDGNKIMNFNNLNSNNVSYFKFDFKNDWSTVEQLNEDKLNDLFQLASLDGKLSETSHDMLVSSIVFKKLKPNENKDEKNDSNFLKEITQTNISNLNDDIPTVVLPSTFNHLISFENHKALKNQLQIYNCQRQTPLKDVKQGNWKNSLHAMIPTLKSIYDADSQVIITQISRQAIPKFDNNVDFSNSASLGFLELIDLRNKQIRYLGIPKLKQSSTEAWKSYSHLNILSEAEFLVDLSVTKPGNLYVLDLNGNLSEWETGILNLQRSLDEWQRLVMKMDSADLKIERFNESPNKDLKDFKGPKHGKIDPTNAPHVGGNTWAGGSGGFDTAGLGGVGGGYRLDSGNRVYQMSDELKQSVPENVRKAAREFGMKVFKERLKEIQMSPHDHALYTQYLENVKKPIQQLRNILESLEAKDKERQWLKNQGQGDLDDTKLVEAITGEMNVYKKRGEDNNADNSLNMEKPKRLRLVVDCSGSMYRFNGVDKRLEREIETLLMVMESFSGFENKIKYDIMGHSGDGYDVKFVDSNSNPENESQRLKILKTIIAHSQFCSSGDHTFEATKYAIQELSKEDADDYFVIVLSDANFDRYGLSPTAFSSILLETSEKVNAYCIFIGTLGDQAVELKKRLPSSRAFICMNTSDLPKIMQQIFQSAMLNS